MPLAQRPAVLDRIGTGELFALAESPGGIESLIEHPAIMTDPTIPPEQRARLGIGDSLLRLSVGSEDVGDLRNDLTQTLGAAARP